MDFHSGMIAAGVGYAVRRGEAISIEGNYQLIDLLDAFLHIFICIYSEGIILPPIRFAH